MSARRTYARRSDEGVALLLALLFIVLLSVLVVEFAYENQIEASFVDAKTGQFEAEIAAKSAVASGMALLAADANMASMSESLQNVPGLSGVNQQLDQMAGLAECDSLLDTWAIGIPFRQINKAVMRCTISDEYGKINLNALVSTIAPPMGVPATDGDTGGEGNTPQPAPSITTPALGADGEDAQFAQSENLLLAEAVRLLFEARGVDSDPTDAILDWIDADEEPRPNGAENDFYGALEVPYGCKNAPMDSVEELLLIKGITPELFFGNGDMDQLPLNELFTVRGERHGRVNINTAQPEVLQAFGEGVLNGQTGLAERVLEERELNPITSQEDAQTRGILQPVEPNAAPQTNVPPQDDNNGQPVPQPIMDLAQQPFVFSSRVFRIRGDGECNTVAVRVEAYVSRNAQGGAMGMGGLGGLDTDNDNQPNNDNDNKPNDSNKIGGDDNGMGYGGGQMFRILDWRIER